MDVPRLLADHTRLAILALLKGTEMSITTLAETLERPTPAISQHLAKLRAGHLVATRREGTTVFYAQASELVAALVTNVLHHTEHSLYPLPLHHQ